jgi:hypothetical protein
MTDNLPKPGSLRYLHQIVALQGDCLESHLRTLTTNLKHLNNIYDRIEALERAIRNKKRKSRLIYVKGK